MRSGASVGEPVEWVQAPRFTAYCWSCGQAPLPPSAPLSPTPVTARSLGGSEASLAGYGRIAACARARRRHERTSKLILSTANFIPQRLDTFVLPPEYIK